jgi:hypothetical protein
LEREPLLRPGYNLSMHKCRMQSIFDRSHRRCFMHYGAFSQNRHIDEHNVALYRRIQNLKRVGLFGFGDPFTRAFAVCTNRALFGHVERSIYVPGWGKPRSDSRAATDSADITT